MSENPDNLQQNLINKTQFGWFFLSRTFAAGT